MNPKFYRPQTLNRLVQNNKEHLAAATKLHELNSLYEETKKVIVKIEKPEKSFFYFIFKWFLIILLIGGGLCHS